MEYKEKFTSF